MENHLQEDEVKEIEIEREDERITLVEKWAEQYAEYEMIPLAVKALKKNHTEAYCLTKYLLDELEDTTNKMIERESRISINDFHEKIKKKKLEGSPENCIDFVMRRYPELHLTDDSEKLLDPLRKIVDEDTACFKDDFKTICDFVINIRHHDSSSTMAKIAVLISALALLASGIVPFFVPK